MRKSWAASLLALIGLIIFMGFQNCQGGFQVEVLNSSSSLQPPGEPLPDSDSGLMNLSRNKPVATLNTTGPSASAASRLNDGQAETTAYPASFNIDYEIHLGNNYPIKRIHLDFGSYAGAIYVENWEVSGIGFNGVSTRLASGTRPEPAFNVDVEGTFHRIRIRASSTQNWIGIQELEVWGENRPSIQYFGYYGVHMPNAEVVSGHANIAQYVGSQLQAIRQSGQLGVKSYVILTDYFFNVRPAAEGGGLRSDYRARWATYADQIRPQIQDVAAFSVMDEPYWNFQALGFTRAQAKQMVETAIAEVKSTFPTVPAMIVEAFPVIDAAYQPPENADWIGFDCYGPFDNCAGRSIPQYVSTLKSRLVPGQKIILVPKAHFRTTVGGPGYTPQSVQENLLLADQFLDLALREPLVVALIPFIWTDFIESNGTVQFIGVGSTPELRQRYNEIGRGLTRPAW